MNKYQAIFRREMNREIHKDLNQANTNPALYNA
jgi:hypothetical protein